MVSLAGVEVFESDMEGISFPSNSSSTSSPSWFGCISTGTFVGICTMNEVSVAFSSRNSLPLCSCTNEVANVSPMPEPGWAG